MSKRPSLTADLAATSVTQALTLVLSAASLAILSRRLGELDLGLYTLERRAMALVQPLVLVGLTVATPRYVALSLGREDRREGGYALTGLTLVIALAGLLALPALAFPQPAAILFLGDAGHTALARALAGFVFATAVYQVVYSVFRGYLRMGRANGLELTVVGVLPCLLAAGGPLDLVAFMWLLNAGIAAAVVVALASAPGVLRPAARRVRGALRQRTRRLLRYGFARTPGDAAIVGVFSLAPIAVVHSAGAVEAGYTSVVQSTVSLVAAAAVPLGVVLLPRAAAAAGAGSVDRDRSYGVLAHATVDVGLILTGVAFVASPLLVRLWLPSAPGAVVTAQQIAVLGIAGYVFYIVFRSYLDAVDTRPLSSIPALAGFGLIALLLPAALGSGAMAAPVAASSALAAALALTGGVTLRLACSRVAGFPTLRSSVPAAACLVASVPLGLAIADGPASLIGAGAGGALAGSAAVLLAVRRPWLVELTSHLRRTPRLPVPEGAR
jgi:O-antigen/teichoic acid export membrane protein